jgi:hypothetical protein
VEKVAQTRALETRTEGSGSVGNLETRAGPSLEVLGVGGAGAAGRRCVVRSWAAPRRSRLWPGPSSPARAPAPAPALQQRPRARLGQGRDPARPWPLARPPPEQGGRPRTDGDTPPAGVGLLGSGRRKRDSWSGWLERFALGRRGLREGWARIP